MYLMIQNPGVAPIEAFTILGVSPTRIAYSERVIKDDNDLDLLIGMFGSGSKHAINILLRNDLVPTVFCGRMRLNFYVKPERMDDGLTHHCYGQVRCKISGKTLNGVSVNRDDKLGFALEYGIHDWDDLSMGLREFVSNAIDRTIREEGKFLSAINQGRLKIEVVNDNQVRAKDGYTRVFIPFNDKIQRFYIELPKRFLHFSEPELIRQIILPKRDRNFGVVKGAVIYRKGVFVRESGNLSSLFDYNFSDELRIDESRNVDDWRVGEAAAVAMRLADTDTLVKVYRSLIKNEETWESKLDKYYLSIELIYDENRRKQAMNNWAKAWELASDGGVLVESFEGSNNYLAERAKRKGFRTVSVPNSNWTSVSINNGPLTVYKALSEHEVKGRDIVEATPYAQEAVNIVWGWIEEVGLTGGNVKPIVSSFHLLPDAESETFGFYENGIVYINVIHSNNGVNNRLLQTALDELTHHVTGSLDCSRDFQSFLMRMIIEKFTQKSNWSEW
jgi:hypothetical protein